MKYFGTLLIMFLVSGCTNSNNSSAANSAGDDGKICKLEKTTGSNIATRVCRTKEQIAYQEKISKEAMREMTRGSVKIDK